MPFEIFDFDKVVNANSPSIRIGKNNIVVNKALLTSLKTPKVELAFDRKTKTIRIKSVPEDAKGILLDRSKIAAKPFLLHFQIDIEGRFEAKFDEKEGCYFVKLE